MKDPRTVLGAAGSLHGESFLIIIGRKVRAKGKAPPPQTRRRGGSPCQQAWPGLGGPDPGSGVLRLEAPSPTRPLPPFQHIPQRWPGRGRPTRQLCLHPQSPTHQQGGLAPQKWWHQGSWREDGKGQGCSGCFCRKARATAPDAPVFQNFLLASLAPPRPAHLQGPVAEEGLNVS